MTQPEITHSENQSSPPHNRPPTLRGSLRSLVRDPLNLFLTITRDYGDIVCYRPAPDPAYLLNHPDYVRHVLVDNNRNYSKATHSNQIFKNVVGSGLIASEGDHWRSQRRLMQPAFHHSRIAALDQIVLAATEDMLNKWQDFYDRSLPVNFTREMSSLTLAITTRALFGVDLGEKVKEIGDMINRVANLFEKPSNPVLLQARNDLQEIVDYIIRERRRNFQDTGDLLSAMLLAQDEESKARIDEIGLRDQLMGLLLAGYETTANALSWTWYLLSKNLWSVEQLRREVRQELAGRPPVYADLDHLPYVHQVLSEGLRLYPPAWILGRRALGEDEIGGYYVAPNTVIAISIYTLHRHPMFWENPENFDPDRFFPERSSSRHKFAYLPFGAGPRQCIGNGFAQMEASLIITCIAQRFELHLIPGIEVQPQPLFVLRPNSDILMSLHR